MIDILLCSRKFDPYNLKIAKKKMDLNHFFSYQFKFNVLLTNFMLIQVSACEKLMQILACTLIFNVIMYTLILNILYFENSFFHFNFPQ